ncbi:TIGR03435 family protein [Silvibacterium sp.]|uniref:TIGR03435 family protein n=1 Tax=Silvibacterium sp. TaxID=1964179 RepID=UPI0039E5573A
MTIGLYIPAELKQTLLNHLWQTTAVVLLAWALALCFRNNHAQLRYRIWMAASAKFLIPFSLLVAAGHVIHPATTAVMSRQPLEAWVAHSVQPYMPGSPPVKTTSARATAAPDRGEWLFAVCIVAWAAGVLFITGSWLRTSFALRLLRQRARPWGMREDVPVLLSDGILEPGVLGILRPAILMPAELLQRLSAAEIETIFEHELSHVRRRDNLTAAFHTMILAFFWFHPLVWVIRARLFDERERACDELVIASGKDAEIYAHSLLDVCRFYLEAPAESMTGVTGGELKERVLRITSDRRYKRLSTNGKLSLAMLTAAVLLLPFAAGAVDSREVFAQDQPEPQLTDKRPSFEVVSIRPDNNTTGMSWYTGFNYERIDRIALKFLVEASFNLKNFQVQSAPDWSDSQHYTINAKMPEGMDKLPQEEFVRRCSLMLQSMLIDRFHLRYHWTTKKMSIYALEVDKGGAKVKKAGPLETYGLTIGHDTYDAHALAMSDLANNLGNNLDRIVIDRTGLTGKYTFTLKYPPDPNAQPTANTQTESEARLLTALHDQLGLKLVAEKQPVPILVIDNIERPTPN